MNIRTPLVIAAACALAACQPPAPQAPVSSCLKYGPALSTLSGMASQQAITAPDKGSRMALLLKLDAPACVDAKPGDAQFPGIAKIDTIELIPQSNATEAHQLAGQRVTGHGALVPITGDGAAAPVGLRLVKLGPEKK